MKHGEIVSFLWDVANLIRDTFKRGKYQDVILPLTVLRRLDCVLASTKPAVLETEARYKSELENRDGLLRRASGFAFYNTSNFDFDRLLEDHKNLAANLRKYIAGFSPNMREVVEKFDFDNTISKLDEAGLLFQAMHRFNDPAVNLHPDNVDNATMGTIFEELIRKFNEALNENPGEHFTPRDVVHLMVDLLLTGDQDQIRIPNKTLTVYDPCCGSGGMLTIAKEHITAGVRKEEQSGANGCNGAEIEFERDPINDTADIHLFGQEVNPETFAVCKSDLYMKSDDGRDAEHILYGSVLSNDRHADQSGFDYLIANPPYGKDWKRDKDAVQAEHADNTNGRFGPGLPRISDGQLLFLLHMLSHTKEPSQGGSRVAIIMNGSPLFTGDAGSGESEIRRFILENDWLEALIALPEQLFYNTGIATYVWILSNRKAPERRGKVQLIDASSEYFWRKMKKSLGDKRRRIPFERAEEILQILADFERDDVRTIPAPNGNPEKAREVTVSKIFPTTHFGFRKITVERPLRLNFEATAERIAQLEDERAFVNLATSKKKQTAAREKEEAQGRAQQDAIRAMLETLPSARVNERDKFETQLAAAAKAADIKLPGPVKKAILSALSERDPEAPVCMTSKGEPEPDSELRDTESVPLAEPIEDFFEREVKPHVPDAWIDRNKCDEHDGEVGIVGYEINFNRYFYRYTPPRELADIERDIRGIEKDIVRRLAEVTGSKLEDLAG